jgi:DNA-binding response OmpR family regulator
MKDFASKPNSRRSQTILGRHRAGLPMTSSNAHGPPESSDVKGLHVVLVEDSWHVGFGLKNLLLAWGVDVDGPVATAADAERLISKHVPDLAIVDLNLRDGEAAYDLIDRLHEQGVRVIVMTGYSQVQLAPGKAAAILHKPFGDEQLLAALHRATKRAT